MKRSQSLNNLKSKCSISNNEQEQETNLVDSPPSTKSTQDHKELVFEDLPDEIISKILSKLDYRSHNRVRCVSRSLNRIDTQYMLHCFRTNSHLSHLERNVNKELAVAYEILNVATKYYLECGFEAAFCGALHTLFKRLNRCSATSYNEEVNRFLRHYYKVVESQTNEETNSSTVRVVYTLTFMSALRKFPNFRLVRSHRQGLHWHFQIELRGVFLGLLWWKEYQLRMYPRKLTHVLAIICELAHINLMNHSMQRVCESPHIVYLYGCTSAPQRPRAPQTTFDFMVYADDSIVQLLRSVLELNVPAKLPSCLPESEFIVNATIKSRKAVNLGCRETIDLYVGPINPKTCDCDSDTTIYSYSDDCSE